MGMIFQDDTFGNMNPAVWMPASAFEGAPNEQDPFGFFDPLCRSGEDGADVFNGRRRREIQHGCGAMFAAVGCTTPDYYKFAGYSPPSLGLDVVNFMGMAFRNSFDPLCLSEGSDAEVFDGRRCSEIEHGRVATIAAMDCVAPGYHKFMGPRFWPLGSKVANLMGMIYQNGTFATMSPAMCKPASAFENALRVQAPVGFFDSLGLLEEMFVYENNNNNFRNIFYNNYDNSNNKHNINVRMTMNSVLGILTVLR